MLHGGVETRQGIIYRPDIGSPQGRQPRLAFNRGDRHLFQPHVRQLVIDFLDLLHRLGDFQALGNNMLPYHFQSSVPSHRLNAAHAGSDGTLALNLEQADILRIGNMSSAAEFHGNPVQPIPASAHLDHAHHIPVLVAEELGNRGIALHVRIGAFRAVHGKRLLNPAVHFLFNQAELIRRNGAAVKVKAQPVFRNKGPLLGRIRADHLMQGAVKKMRGGVMRLNAAAAFRVNAQMHAVAGPHLQPGTGLHHMGSGIPYLLDGHHMVAFPADFNQTGIGYLPAHFRVKRSLVRDDEQGIPLAAHFQHRSGAFVHIVSRKFRHGVRLQIQGAHHLALAGGPGAFPLFLHQPVEPLHINIQAAFLRQQGGQVNGEPVRIIQLEGELAAHLSGGSRFRVKQFQAAVQRLIKTGLFTVQNLLHGSGAGGQFREHLSEGLHQRIHQFRQKRLGKAQAAPIAHGTAQNAAQHVITAIVARQNAVRNGKTERAQMIGNHAEGNRLLKGPVLRIHPFGTGRRIHVRVLPSAQNFQAVKQGAEYIRGVIGRFAGKILESVRALHDGARALKPHPGIHMTCRKIAHGAVALRIVLDKHQVPYLYALVGILVYQASLRIPLRGQVHVQLGTGAAGAGFPHHPEIILHIPVHDMHVRVQPSGTEQLSPEIPGFPVKLSGVALALVRRVHGGVQAFRRKSPPLHDQLPGPADSFLLEIIPEGPVPQHFKKRVVVGVIPHILQVIVLAACADALLGIRSAGGRPRGSPYAQEIRDKLIHAGICKQQTGALGHQRSGRHDRVLFFAEKVQKALAYLGGGHHNR